LPQIVCCRFIKKKSKQRFGEFESEYFGGSDVENKLNIMIILELISPQQRTIEQKYLLTTQKKITIIKKKKEDREYCHRPPARPRSITEEAEKSQFLVN